jgi:acetyl-CoA acetyltransferase
LVTDATSRLLQEALALGPDERAALAAELLASLDEVESDVQRAWAAEIERRSLAAPEERGEDWRVVLDDIRASVLRLETGPQSRRPRAKSFATPRLGTATGIPRSLIDSFAKKSEFLT